MNFKSSALSSIALSSIALSSIGTQSAALSSIALSSIPISTPGGWEAVLQGTPLQGSPPQSVTLAQLLSLNPQPAALSSITLGELGLGSSALQSLSLVSVALGSTALSSIPVPGGAADWCAALAAASPPFSCASIGLSSTTIGSATLLQLDAAGAPIRSLALSSIALSSIGLSPSALSSIALSSIALSSIDLSAIKLSDIALSSINVQGAALSSIALSSIPVPGGAGTWCDVFAAGGHTCPSLGIDNNSTLFTVVNALQLKGIPLQSTALGSVALSSIALSSISPGAIALSSIALSSIAVNGTALSSIALSSINIQSSFLASIALSSIPLSAAGPNNSPLSAIALSSITSVINCALVNCATGTLGQAADALAILPGATLGQIAGAVGPFTLGDVRFYGTATVQDVLNAVNGTPAQLTYFLSILYGGGVVGDVSRSLGGVTLGQILIAVLARSDYPWEDVSLSALSQADLPAADTANAVNYRASFTYLGGSSATSVQIAVTLPAGFHYLKGTSALTVLNGSPAAAAPIGDPAVTGNQAVWTVPAFTAGAQVAIDFKVRPGLVLGPGNAASITVSDAGHPAVSASGQAPVTVTQNFAPNVDPASAPIIGPDQLVISHIASAGDRGFFRIPANLPPGARVEILLSHQAQDNDLALFRPAATQLRSPSGAALSSIPLQDAPDSIGPTTKPPAQVLQDVNIASLALSSISANRGTSNDRVSTTSLNDSGYFTIEVAGYNGAFGNGPYVLREKVSPPPIPPQCPPRVMPFAGQGVAGVAPVSLPASVNTLFLVNEKRLGDLYGAAKAASVVSALNTLAGRGDLGVTGAVIPVEGNAAVASAYAGWDANPCSPTGANAVVTAINAMVDGYRGGLPDLQNVVITGDDDVIPFARIPDLTHVSNERDYASDIVAINGEGALLGSFVTSNVLSDNPYGAFHPVPWLDHQLYVPNVAVGRLVETPGQIVAQVDQFVRFNGTLDPKTALTTGYDFLSDGATQVANALDGIVGAANDTRLINNTWTSADLAAHFNNGTPVPDIASINAHYDHRRLLPGAGNALGSLGDLFTTQNIVRPPLSPQILPGRVLFSMGCHAGLNISDAFAGTPGAAQAQLLLDWPQAYADQGAAVYVGNTGYGYGDTATVAYSEQLMADFAKRLGGGLTIGQALTYAKQDYFGSLAQYQTYDEKVLSETAFYGLPMFRIGPPKAPPPPPAPLPFTTDAVTGLPAVQLSLAPQFTQVNLGARGSYYAISGQSEATSGRPIEPVTGVDLPADAAGRTARGIIVTAMTSSDQSNFHAVFSKPTVDASLPEQVSTEPFPASIHNLTTFFAPEGQRQRAVFAPAQFIPDPAVTPGTGTERLFTSITGEALYSSSADVTPPTILEARADRVGGVVSFAVDARDDAPNSVVRVLVLYNASGSPQWTGLDLVNTPGTTRWTSSATVSGDINYFVYAVDGGGNVGVSSNKATLHRVVSIAPPAGLTLTVSGTPAGGGWYASAQVTVSGAAGVTFETSIDSGPFQAYTGPVAVTGDGIHFVTARGSDTSTGTTSVAVDSDAPIITVQVPANGSTLQHSQAATASYRCDDAGSGVRSCSGSLANGAAIDTSVPGTYTLTVTAVDIVGHQRTLTASYTVAGCPGDRDCDGLPDSYELAHPCLNPNVQDANADPDHDGLTNLQEYQLGTDPCNPDTDGDGYPDGQEVALGKNPLAYCAIMRADVNGDGVVNILDLAAIAAYINQPVTPANARFNQNADLAINIIDIAAAAGRYTQTVASCP
ncbi:MAG: dockerin type I domain-containing protein [Dehalococcoidia bacterium]